MVSDEPRDLARYLPLSIRPRVDESGVTDDWGTRLDDLVRAVPYAGGAFEAAVARARARKKVRVADLGAALIEAYTLGEVEVDDVTSGAVALARALRAPLPVRAVLRGRTLRATDADWSFGSGPELTGTAREIVLFLYGRGPVPAS